MGLRDRTRAFEAWLARETTLVSGDIAYKHREMRRDAFRFLRGTYYRWAEIWPEVCPSLQGAPTVLSVGDLHLENFGSWRDSEGRLAWGINDFDDAALLPYWNTLPIVIEEGLAQLAFHKYSNMEVPVGEVVLDAIAALSLSHEEYNSLKDPRPATYTGVVMAQRLGVVRLRGLAMRAHEAGEKTIPSQWIVDALAASWQAVGTGSSPASK